MTMIREIIKDQNFLKIPSEPATIEDIAIAQDLLDTLRHHTQHCVGLAANMIGFSKRIIVIDDNGTFLLLLNPEIVKAQGSYQTEESCLSLEGSRPAKRFQKIKVKYQNQQFQTRFKTFEGFSAQIIQHEIDHCNGIII